MAGSTQVSLEAVVNLRARKDSLKKIVADVEEAMSNVDPSSALGKSLAPQLRKVKTMLEDVEILSGSSFIDENDLKRFTRMIKSITDTISGMEARMSSRGVLSSFLLTGDEEATIARLQREIDGIGEEMKKATAVSFEVEVTGIEEAKKLLKELKDDKTLEISDDATVSDVSKQVAEQKKLLALQKQQAEQKTAQTKQEMQAAEAEYQKYAKIEEKVYREEQDGQKRLAQKRLAESYKNGKLNTALAREMTDSYFSGGRGKAGSVEALTAMLEMMGVEPGNSKHTAGQLREMLYKTYKEADEKGLSSEVISKFTEDFSDKELEKRIAEEAGAKNYKEYSNELKKLQKEKGLTKSAYENAEQEFLRLDTLESRMTELENSLQIVMQNLQADLSARQTQAQETLKNFRETTLQKKIASMQEAAQHSQELKHNAASDQSKHDAKRRAEEAEALAAKQQEKEDKAFQERLSQSIKQWMGIRDVVNYAKRGIREAWQDIQGLDKAMTNIAVVTNFSVGDLWGKIGEYMDIAQQYGVTTQGVYEVSQLYYQQGLGDADTMAATTETLKMARIAGMGYQDAADGMTVAIRGFKMEMTDAAHVTDVYSKVAAVTASDTQELVAAMSKTASSAESVGSEFENTTAMLAVMIEATRESPENIGSAMKSIISRYGELTKEAKIDTDGEIIDYNKVDTALKSVGISLKDSQGQFRDFDVVVEELASKWDSLDSVTQRYIATTFAGNRQQSRFLALVGNYERYMEVKEAAENSEDAGLLQYSKTLDSMETKLNNIKTNFQQFYMSIFDGEAAKGFLDFINNTLEGLNNLSSGKGFGALITSIAPLFSMIRGGKLIAQGGLAKAMPFASGMARSYTAQQKQWWGIPDKKGTTASQDSKRKLTLYERFTGKTKSAEAQSGSVTPNVTGNGASGTTAQATFQGMDGAPTVNINMNVNVDAEGIENQGNSQNQTQQNQVLSQKQQSQKGMEVESLPNSTVFTNADKKANPKTYKKTDEFFQTRKGENVSKLISPRTGETYKNLTSQKFFTGTSIGRSWEEARKDGLTWGDWGTGKGAKLGQRISIGGAILGGVLSGAANKAAQTDIRKGHALQSIGDIFSFASTGAALGPGGALVGGIIGVIKAIKTAPTELEVAQQKLEQLSQKNEEAQLRRAEANNKTTTLDQTIKKLKKLEETQFDSAEAYEEFIAANQAAIDQFPELATYFDESKNAIVDLSAAESELAQLRAESAQATREAALAQLRYNIQQKETERQKKEEFIKNLQFGKPNNFERVPFTGEIARNDYTWGEDENGVKHFFQAGQEVTPSEEFLAQFDTFYNTTESEDGSSVYEERKALPGGGAIVYTYSLGGNGAMSDVAEVQVGEQYGRMFYTETSFESGNFYLDEIISKAGKFSSGQEFLHNMLNLSEEDYIALSTAFKDVDNPLEAFQKINELRGTELGKKMFSGLDDDTFFNDLARASIDSKMEGIDYENFNWIQFMGLVNSYANSGEKWDKLLNLERDSVITTWIGTDKEKRLSMGEEETLYDLTGSEEFFHQLAKDEFSSSLTNETEDTDENFLNWIENGSFDAVLSEADESSVFGQFSNFVEYLRNSGLLEDYNQLISDFRSGKLTVEEFRTKQSSFYEGTPYKNIGEQLFLLETGEDSSYRKEIDRTIKALGTRKEKTGWDTNIYDTNLGYHKEAATILEDIPEIYHSGIIQYSDMLAKQVEKGEIDQETATALIDQRMLLLQSIFDSDQLTDTQKHDLARKIGETDWANAASIADLQHWVDTELGEGLFNFTGILEDASKGIFGYDFGQITSNLVTAYADLNSQLTTNLSTMTEDLKAVSEGISDPEKLQSLMDKYDLTIDDFTFSNGKYFLNNTEAIQEYYTKNREVQLQALREDATEVTKLADQVSLSEDEYESLLTASPDDWRTYGSFTSQDEFKRFQNYMRMYWDQDDYKTWAAEQGGGEKSLSAYFAEKFAKLEQESLDLIQELEQYEIEQGKRNMSISSKTAQLENRAGDVNLASTRRSVRGSGFRNLSAEDAATIAEDLGIGTEFLEYFDYDDYSGTYRLDANYAQVYFNNLKNLYGAIEDQKFEDLFSINEEGKWESRDISGAAKTTREKVKSRLAARGITEDSENFETKFQEEWDAEVQRMQTQLSTLQEGISATLDTLFSDFSDGMKKVGDSLEGVLSLADIAQYRNKYGLQDEAYVTAEGATLSDADTHRLVLGMFKELGNVPEAGKIAWEAFGGKGIFESVSDINAEIKALTEDMADGKIIGYNFTIDEAKEYLAVLEQIRDAAMLDENAYEFNFMDQEVADGKLKNFDNFVGQIDKVKNTMASFQKGDYVDYKDFINMMEFMSKYSPDSEFSNKLEAMGVSYEDFVNSVIRNTDEWGKVNIGGVAAEMGISVDAAMSMMSEGMTDGLKEVARQQIKYLSSLEKMLQALMVLEEIGNSDIGLKFEITMDINGDGSKETISNWQVLMQSIAALPPKQQKEIIAKIRPEMAKNGESALNMFDLLTGDGKVDFFEQTILANLLENVDAISEGNIQDLLKQAGLSESWAEGTAKYMRDNFEIDMGDEIFSFDKIFKIDDAGNIIDFSDEFIKIAGENPMEFFNEAFMTWLAGVNPNNITQSFNSIISEKLAGISTIAGFTFTISEGELNIEVGDNSGLLDDSGNLDKTAFANSDLYKTLNEMYKSSGLEVDLESTVLINGILTPQFKQIVFDESKMTSGYIEGVAEQLDESGNPLAEKIEGKENTWKTTVEPGVEVEVAFNGDKVSIKPPEEIKNEVEAQEWLNQLLATSPFFKALYKDGATSTGVSFTTEGFVEFSVVPTMGTDSEAAVDPLLSTVQEISTKLDQGIIINVDTSQLNDASSAVTTLLQSLQALQTWANANQINIQVNSTDSKGSESGTTPVEGETDLKVNIGWVESEKFPAPNSVDVAVNYTGVNLEALGNGKIINVKVNYIPTGVGMTTKWTGNMNSISGTAYANGNVGALTSGARLANKTLVGELGPELAVYGDRYHLLGQNGAEFVDLPKDALVFNHLQTAGILSGQMKNARATAVFPGSAMVNGNVSGPAAKGGIGAALAAVQRAKSVWQGLLNSLSAADLMGGGGSGGGGGNDLKAHIADLQEWYNLSRQIADIEQRINTLLAKRENITDGHKYLQNLRETQALLEDQVNTQQDLLKYQEDQLAAQAEHINNHKLWSQFLTVDENGLLQYIEGNETNGGKGALQVLDEMNKMSGEEQVAFLEKLGYTYTDNDGKELEEGELVAKFYEELQKQIDDYDALRDTVTETEGALEELETSINEIDQEIRQNEIDLSQEIYDIIVDAWKENIDNLKEQNDLIKEANDAYAQGIEEAIAREQEQYDQNTAIQDRERLQRQLSLLRRSGGSASEIADLEQQLDETLKDEYFRKQEEALKNIQDANERQVKLMEQQVKMQEEALRYEQENGVIWTKVYEVLQGTDAEILAFMQGHHTKFFEQSALQQEDMLLDWAKKVGIFNEEKAYQHYIQQAQQQFDSVWETEKGGELKSTWDSLSKDEQENLQREWYDQQYASEVVNGKSEEEAETFAQKEFFDHLEAEKKRKENNKEQTNNGSKNGSNSGNNNGGKNGATSNSKNSLIGKRYQAWGEKSSGARDYGAITTNEEDAKKEEKNRFGKFPYIWNGIRGPFAKGGIIDFTGPAWVDGSKSEPERILTAEQNQILEEGLAMNAGRGNALKEALTAFATSQMSSIREVFSRISSSMQSQTFSIAPGAVVIHVDELANGYDVDELYNDITEKLYSIASKSSSRGVNRR